MLPDTAAHTSPTTIGAAHSQQALPGRRVMERRQAIASPPNPEHVMPPNPSPRVQVLQLQSNNNRKLVRASVPAHVGPGQGFVAMCPTSATYMVAKQICSVSAAL